MDIVKYIYVGVALLAIVSCGGRQKKVADSLPRAVPHRVIEVTGDIMENIISDTIDLGVVRRGEVVSQDISLRNLTGSNLIILSVSAGCGCTTVDFDKKPASPGEDISLSFLYNSEGYHGFQSKSVNVLTSLSKNPIRIILLVEVE